MRTQDTRPQYWHDLLGDDVCDMLIKEAHDTIAEAKEEPVIPDTQPVTLKAV